MFKVCDDRDMSLKTSLTHIALTTAFVDATACDSAQNQRINHPRHREMDTSRIEVKAPTWDAEIAPALPVLERELADLPNAIYFFYILLDF